ncbi:MAG: type II toxin-antitoxin system RelE/ParE family toxin [Acetobacteraceae bacterium]|nr:type II toxin-antitoxin system RelE/ParE family toxin [Acetobacteraceae bacterium]
MARRVRFARRASADLDAIRAFIAREAGPARASAFVLRIVERCEKLAQFPLRGTARPELRPLLRTMGLGRRLTIAFRVDAEGVVILRILYGGRSLERAFRS